MPRTNSIGTPRTFFSSTRPTNLKPGDRWSQSDSSGFEYALWQFDGSNFYSLENYAYDISYSGTTAQVIYCSTKRSPYNASIYLQNLYISSFMAVDPAVAGNTWSYALNSLTAANAATSLASGSNVTGLINTWLSQSFSINRLVTSPIFRLTLTPGTGAQRAFFAASIAYSLVA